MIASRRRILSFLGSAPLAARAAGEAVMSRLTSIGIDGIGNASMGLPGAGFGPPAEGGVGQFVPHEQKIIGAADFVRTFGLPESVDFKMRDEARYVSSLDPDIASKRSWSMNVKVAAQRQRNYERAVERITLSGAHLRTLATVKALLGFDWPW